MQEKNNHRNKAKLWEAFAQGDEVAFQRLFELWYTELLFFGLRINMNQAVVKDRIQDVFFDLWNKRQQLPKVKNHNAYVKQILKRKILKAVEKKEKQKKLSPIKPVVSFSYETLLIQ